MTTKTTTSQIGIYCDGDCGAAWRTISGVTHYDALSVVCDSDDSDDVFAALDAAGYGPRDRRHVRAVRGNHGDVIHEVRSGD